MFHSISTNRRSHRLLRAAWFVACMLKKKIALHKMHLFFHLWSANNVTIFSSLQKFLVKKWKKLDLASHLPQNSFCSNDTCDAFAADIFCSSVWIVWLMEQRNCWAFLRNEVPKSRRLRPSQFLWWLAVLMKSMELSLWFSSTLRLLLSSELLCCSHCSSTRWEGERFRWK